MNSMLRKKEVFTIITPIPGFIPRQLAIDILHSHSEVITLNPLVLDHKPIKAPRNAASDEYYSTWYEINQRIQYVPGLGKMGSGKISFNGCFHDMPWGLQTHIYAPMNVDLKNRYRIAGNQPGVEPPEQQEIGLAQLGAPTDGLYLRDDVEIKCNVAVVGFVKSQLKSASKEMVSRIIKKAELLDAGILQGMIENGKLKTLNPNDRSYMMSPDGSMSPRAQYSPTFNPNDRSHTMTPDQPTPYQVPRPSSYQHFTNRPGSVAQNGHWSAPYGGLHAMKHPPAAHAELAESKVALSAPVEMPGDYSFPQPSPRLAPPQPSPTYPSDQGSTASGHSSRTSPRPNAAGGGDWRWSESQQSQQGTNPSRPTSVQSDVSGGGAMHSPGLPADHLPTHEEEPEHDVNVEALRKLDPAASRRAQYAATSATPPPQSRQYAYNPADYAKMGAGAQPPARQASYGYKSRQ